MDLAFQIGSGTILSINTYLLIRLSFAAGKLVQKVEDLDHRVMRLELGGCGEKKE